MGKVLEIGICKNKGDKIIPLNEVHAIKGEGLTPVFKVSNSSNQFFVFLVPDCIAVFVGLYIFAFLITYQWSGRQDLNLRPSGPKPDALPDCATPRLLNFIY